jgi:predicted MFS family arabinose efflux permease
MQSYHVTAAFQIIGMAALGVICLSAFVIAPCPQDFKPDGWSPSAKAEQRTVREYDYKEMLKSPLFLTMIVMMTCGVFAGLVIISQASPIAQRMIGFSAAQAATAVSVLAMFNTLGRIAAGAVSDRRSQHPVNLVFLLDSRVARIIPLRREQRPAVLYRHRGDRVVLWRDHGCLPRIYGGAVRRTQQ